MARAEVDIKRCGNDLGLRLPNAVSEAAGMRAGQRVRVSVRGRDVVITPADDDALTLHQRLALFDSARHGGEAFAVPPEGAERR